MADLVGMVADRQISWDAFVAGKRYQRLRGAMGSPVVRGMVHRIKSELAHQFGFEGVWLCDGGKVAAVDMPQFRAQRAATARALP
jgi:hypothetical protein